MYLQYEKIVVRLLVHFEKEEPLKLKLQVFFIFFPITVRYRFLFLRAADCRRQLAAAAQENLLLRKAKFNDFS